MTLPQRNTNPILDIQGLRVEVLADDGDGWREVVHGIDLTLKRGEVVGLIGESGAGKSTIGLAAMGFSRDGSRISGGRVVFDGKDLVTASEKELRAVRGLRIAYVAQSAAAAFNPAHRLIDQYCETPVLKKLHRRVEAEQDARTTYKTLLLPDPDTIGLRYPHQVSGGQLQRAMMAMAMACRPDIIVFDEPTTALDVTTQVEVLTAIKVIVERFNTAALYITHDLAVVAQMADRIMVLRHGNTVELNETSSLLATPAQPYTRDLLAVRKKRKAALPRDADQQALLSVNGISAAYGSHKVLHDVSFEVHPRRTVAIVGESGSGKSTVTRVVTGLLPPTAGRLTYKDQPLQFRIEKRARQDLKRIQLIHQSPDSALNPQQKIGEILGRPLSFYLGLRGDTCKARVLELLQMIELPAAFIDRRPSELSGGEKQRICIARALAAEPELIICDEVTSALDQLVADGILQLLQRLQDSFGLSYLFITHDIDTVRAIADEVIVMQQGRIVEQGPRDTVLSPPHHPYTDLLLSSVPEMNPDWLPALLEKRRIALA
jgi:peptide/nickel transport system ATP-binding protein